MLGSALVIAACAQEPSGRGDQPTELSSGADNAAQQDTAGDAIARFAINAPEGASSQISYGERSVFVTIGNYYRSAAGNRCRRVTIRDPNGGSHLSAVCRDDNSWQTVLNY